MQPAKPAKKAAAPVKADAKKAPAKADAKKPVAAAAKGAAAAKKPQGKKKPQLKLYEARQQDFTIGNDLPPRRDLSRMVRWPKYIRLQRQKAILYKRLTVPPSINQFTHTADKNTTATLFRLLSKYRPEDSAEKKARLVALAKNKGGEGADAAGKKAAVRQVRHQPRRGAH
jgi:large subunit ribosomal protein L7Ae